MVVKTYHIKVNRNMENEIQYIKGTYDTINCGGLTAKTIRVTVDLPNEDAFIEDMASRGVEGFYIGENFVDLSLYKKDAKDNRLVFQITRNLPLTLGTSYTDVIPNYGGMPIPFETTGYKKMGMVLLWNKNGSSAVHTVKLSACNVDGSLVTPEKILREFPITTVGGYLPDFEYIIPANFIDFKGLVKLQAKSGVAGATPIFDGLWLYMIRR
jgi:hypothetical protein